MNTDELSLAVEDCVIASSWRKPESKILDTPEIYKLVNLTAPYEFMNGVYRTRFKPENAEREIESHFQFYKDNKMPSAGMFFLTQNLSVLIR